VHGIGRNIMDIPTFFAKVFPTFVACILVWVDIDKRVLRFSLEKVIPMRCASTTKRGLCIDELSEVVDMLAIAIGFCLTFLVSSWLALDTWQRIYLSSLSVLSLVLFFAYLNGPPSKYISLLHNTGLSAMAERLPKFLAIVYFFLASYVTFFLSV
jgi:hypothetical protein